MLICDQQSDAEHEPSLAPQRTSRAPGHISPRTLVWAFFLRRAHRCGAQHGEQSAITLSKGGIVLQRLWGSTAAMAWSPDSTWDATNIGFDLACPAWCRSLLAL